ncbi:MAG: fimbrillin family protein [Parabacteroides sp.]|nr:fimbrillin family protein [Parabacteroides sp.]
MVKQLQHITHQVFRAIALPALLLLAACGKDAPLPEPVPPMLPDPPEPPQPPVMEDVVRVPLRLFALPEGNDPEVWLPTDTLHLVLTKPGGCVALGDTAFYRYNCTAGAGNAECFAPSSSADSAFMPADSCRVDLLAYYPASSALLCDRLHLPVDTRELTALGHPLMTASRITGLCVVQPEARPIFVHRLARLRVTLNLIETKADANSTKTVLAGTTLTLYGNPAEAVWSLPDEAFVEYGDTLPQTFKMQPDGTGGYLYTLPGMPGELTLSVLIPDRAPISVPLNGYLTDGLLETGISIDIRIEIPSEVDPTPDDPEPDEPDIPDEPDPDTPDDPGSDDPDPDDPPPAKAPSKSRSL